MRFLLLFFLLCSLTYNCFAQRAGEDYAFTSDSRVSLWNDALQEPDSNSIYYRAERGNIFTIMEKVSYRQGNKVIVGYRIVFWPFENGKQVQSVQLQQNPAFPPFLQIVLIRNTEPGLYFFISELDLAAKTTSDFKKPNGFFAVNALVLPIKLRFRNNQPGGIFDFTQSISLGPVVSKTWNSDGAFSSISYSVLFGVNVTNVAVDEKTVPGVITDKTTLFGLSPVIGVSLEYHGVIFGALVGIDIVTGEAGRAWAYRKSPWFGFTVGTSLFATAPATPTQQ